jgi:hypothetical protein
LRSVKPHRDNAATCPAFHTRQGADENLASVSNPLGKTGAIFLGGQRFNEQGRVKGGMFAGVYCKFRLAKLEQ